MERYKTIGQAQDYLRELKYNVWYSFSDVDESIFDEVFDLIDENYLCKYEFGDNNNFRKK